MEDAHMEVCKICGKVQKNFKHTLKFQLLFIKNCLAGPNTNEYNRAIFYGRGLQTAEESGGKG